MAIFTGVPASSGTVTIFAGGVPASVCASTVFVGGGVTTGGGVVSGGLGASTGCVGCVTLGASGLGVSELPEPLESTTAATAATRTKPPAM
ncbi:hypothetical protein COEX109129_42160 [Corallococcus exiguus]